MEESNDKTFWTLDLFAIAKSVPVTCRNKYSFCSKKFDKICFQITETRCLKLHPQIKANFSYVNSRTSYIYYIAIG